MNKERNETNPHPSNKAKQDVPDHAIEALARCALPLIQAYFESEEGQREFAAWKADEEKQKPRTQIDKQAR